MFKLSRILLVSIAVGVLPFKASAALIFSNNNASFNSAISVAATDDFEDLSVAVGGVSGLTASITRGEFSYSASGASVLVGLGVGFGGLASIGLAPDLFVESLTIGNTSGYKALGFDFTAALDGTLNVAVFDIFDNILGNIDVVTSSLNLNFFGVFSDVAIGKLVLQDGGIGGPIIDNVIAGPIDIVAETIDVDAPSVLAIFAFGLLGLSARRLTL